MRTKTLEVDIPPHAGAGSVDVTKRQTELKSQKRRDVMKKNISMSEESWWEEEAKNRDLPLTYALDRRLCSVIKECQGPVLSHCPQLTRQVAEEIARISREEPGGMNACRLFVKVVPDEKHIPNHRNGESNQAQNKYDLLSVGSVDMSDSSSFVATFEVYVYLFPSTSLLSRLQSMVFNFSSKKNEDGKGSMLKNVTLSPDFILVKKKLFRSRSNSIEIIRSTER
ncbi:uncharacterized protein LOC143455858 [Clavelina lepadiformis]|uniref:Uncharacterized protein n=1 Tax=Clavelina lepadiformis TaxID=159417 RepID=A0ABP0H0L4_CLALP